MRFKKTILSTGLAVLLLNTTIINARAPSLIRVVPNEEFRPVELPPPIIYEPEEEFDRTHPPIKQLDPAAKVMLKSTPAPEVRGSEDFIYDPNVSWYGPGFYGNRTACGYALTTEILGVAHKSLPCGTLVTFRNPENGRRKTVPVIDRGPYVAGRQWDLTGGLCVALDHCYTGGLEYKIE